MQVFEVNKYEITQEDLALIARERERKAAHEKLEEATEQFVSALKAFKKAGGSVGVKRADGKTYISKGGNTSYFSDYIPGHVTFYF